MAVRPRAWYHTIDLPDGSTTPGYFDTRRVPALVEWPAALRDNAHSVALKACGAALRGEIEAETARGLFAAFAEKHDLLAPETNVLVASRLRRDRDPHIR